MLNKEKKLEAFERALEVMDRLRADCPWNHAQTIDTLRPMTIEEVYELSDAVLKKDEKALEKELGDVFLHVIFYAKIAEEEGRYDIADVLNKLCEKMIYRHPHVFSTTKVADAEEVSTNWEMLKAKEKGGDYCVYVADPDKGFKKYSRQEFIDCWASTCYNNEEAGIALLLEPTAVFYEMKDKQYDTKAPRNKFRYLMGYVNRYRTYFYQIILGLIISTVIQLSIPFLTQSLVDTGIEGKDMNFVKLILIAEFTLLFSNTAISFIRSKILLHISTRINISLISDFFIKLMKLSMKTFDVRLMGDLLQRIEDPASLGARQDVRSNLDYNSFHRPRSFFTSGSRNGAASS